jgi:hypothetical protein
MHSAQAGALRAHSKSAAYKKSMATATSASTGKLSAMSIGTGDIISHKTNYIKD